MLSFEDFTQRFSCFCLWELEFRVNAHVEITYYDAKKRVRTKGLLCVREREREEERDERRERDRMRR